MSSSARPSHVRFVEPLALPPQDRHRRSDVRYPRVAQRKGEGDRDSFDCHWRFKALSLVTFLAPESDDKVSATSPPDDCYDAAVNELLVRAREMAALFIPAKRRPRVSNERKTELHLRCDSKKPYDTYTLPQLVFDSAESSTTNSSATTPSSEVMPVDYPDVEHIRPETIGGL